MPKDITWLPNIGLIGTEYLSAPIVTRLLAAKYVITAYAKSQASLSVVTGAGASSSGSISQLLQKNDVILLCLPRSEAAVNVIENDLDPILLKEKIIIDLGTTDLNETRRLAKFLKLRNAHFMDAPVAGSMRDIQKGRSLIFCGGSRIVFDRCERILRSITGSTSVSFCGEAGSGQIVKGVYDIAVGLSRAALLEAMSFGIQQGLSRQELWDVLEHTLPPNMDAEKVMSTMALKGGEAVSCNIHEIPHLIRAAEAEGHATPLSRALFEFLKNAKPTVIENGLSVPSFWNELKRTVDS
jgi:3-hydroxyisobutyrate dehydrogenase